MQKLNLIAGALALFMGAECFAALSQAEVDRLGKDLTPLGAERAGNAAGTIPAWNGGLTGAPVGYEEGGFLVDPFPDDSPLFVITAANVAQYQANLTPGQVAMLRKYPDYKMPVYPTRRTAAYTQEIYDDTRQHALTAKLTADGNGVEGRGVGSPFPIPRNGLEAIWNHTLRFRGYSMERETVQVPVQANGSFVETRLIDRWAFPEGFAGGRDPEKDDNISIYFLQILKSPPRLTGNVLLVHETLNKVKQPRKAWRYNAGQRRVRRAPQVAYDAPGSGVDGQRTIDNYDMFNGAPDRYDWKLVGKQELYIPYNSYRLHSPDLSYEEIHAQGHLNQDLTRYELHRVWVVEATLKEGARHIYAKRVFFIDEDTWQAAVIDHYDARGDLWRVAEAHTIQYYNETIPWYTVETLNDLQSGRYLTTGLTNEERAPYLFNIEVQRQDFQPGALRRLGKR
jgi:hypothetical protein